MIYGRYDNLSPGVTNEMIERQANGSEEERCKDFYNGCKCDRCLYNDAKSALGQWHDSLVDLPEDNNE